MVTSTLRILLVEDNAGDARLTKLALSRLPHPIPDVVHVTCVGDAKTALLQDSYDLILTDLDLPDSERLETCTALCQASQGIPVVVLTGSHDTQLGIEAIQMGAQDYLIKGGFQIPELWRVLHHASQRQQSLRSIQDAHAALEKSLAKVQALERMREELVHMIIHDLRSPVSIMRLYLEGFLRDAGDSVSGQLREDISRTYDLSGELVEMISSILDVHRIESEQMPLSIACCDLASIIAEAVKRVASGAHQPLINLDVAEVHVSCDPDLIRRTIANLVSNALRFSPEGKTITIAAHSVGEAIEVAITDQGRGIPQESQQRIFEKFGSIEVGHKSYSTGLGLPFCKSVIDLHGGRIGVRSQPGAGSTFWFTLAACTPISVDT